MCWGRVSQHCTALNHLVCWCRDHGSGSDGSPDGLRQARARKKNPDWAQPVNIVRQMAAQRSINPETIFGKPAMSCDLFEIFHGPLNPKDNGKWLVRSESGDWSQDALKETEKDSFNAHRGWL
jgi:Inner centromere protein, ARK binding region